MKKAPPTFGHVQAQYNLRGVYQRALKRFDEAEKEEERLMHDYQQSHDPQTYQQSWIANDLKMEAGVLLLMTTASLLEEIIYSYAVTFFEAESYEQHVGNVRTVSKWLLLPRLCQGKEIEEDHPAINALKELVLARNAVIHPKRQDMGLDPERADKKVQKEVARFFSACRKARTTVDALIQLLNAPPPSKSKDH